MKTSLIASLTLLVALTLSVSEPSETTAHIVAPFVHVSGVSSERAYPREHIAASFPTRPGSCGLARDAVMAGAGATHIVAVEEVEPVVAALVDGHHLPTRVLASTASALGGFWRLRRGARMH
jgi:hypothetical protein